MNREKVLTPGTILIDRYKVLNLIGTGGVSDVYLVKDLRLNTNWALKVVRLPRDNNFRKVCISESYMLTKLHHPSIPRTVDICEDDWAFYIVMDYVEGRDLGTILSAKGPQTVDNVIDWSIQLCSALYYLHNQQPPIIYRDMKPSNVMLQPNGTVVLIDFGIAREYSYDDIGDTEWLGTRAFAAPEQFGGRGQTDPRTDIYGLGATMYTLITGHPPAEAQSQTLQISEFRPELKSSQLERIIAKCCEPLREDRFQNCNDLLRALERCKNSYSSAPLMFPRIKSFMQDLTKTVSNLANKVGGNGTEETQKRKYQVFISFKHTDDYGKETPDTKLAESLYKRLRAKGIKTYFSKESIVDEASDKYKYSISHALNESRILVVVGTRPDYMNGSWIKKEYREFRSKMKHASSADEYAIFNFLGPEMHVNSLPVELKDYTSFNDVDMLKGVILNRLLGSGKQEEMPIELKAEAVWENYHPGVVINKRYQLSKCVKEGNYYKLYEASDTNVNGNLRLVKVVNNYLIGDIPDPEIECLKLLSDISKGIPTIFDYGHEEDITYLVTNYAHGTRLDKLMKNSTIIEDQVITWMQDLCDTLDSLHSHNPQIIHCNIRPSNIFIEKERAELINFSAAYVEGQSPQNNGFVGGKKYRAPELTVLLKSNQRPTPSIDIYSLGHTMIEALTGEKNIIINSNNKKMSLGLQFVLKKCTYPNPSERYQNVLELKKDLKNIRLGGLKAIRQNMQYGILHVREKYHRNHGMPIPRPYADIPHYSEYPENHNQGHSMFRSRFDSDNQTTLLQPVTYESEHPTSTLSPYEYDTERLFHTSELEGYDSESQ